MLYGTLYWLYQHTNIRAYIISITPIGNFHGERSFAETIEASILG